MAKSIQRNTGKLEFDTLTEMRAFVGGQGLADDETVFLKGSASVNDGEQNFYQWDASSTATDNGTTIIKITAITTGRFLLQRLNDRTIYLEDYGAIGDWTGSAGTDDSTAIQAAITAAAASLPYSEGGVTVYAAAGKSYLHSVGLVIPARVTLDMQGALLSYSGTGTAVTLGDSATVISYAGGFINYKQHLQNKAAKGVHIWRCADARVIGEVEGLYSPYDDSRTNIGVHLDGGNGGSWSNHIEVKNLHMHESFRIKTTGTTFSTNNSFYNCTTFGDASTDPTSLGYNFGAAIEGQGTHIFGGNIEWCGTGIRLLTQAGRVSMFGTRFETSSNTCDIQIGTYTINYESETGTFTEGLLLTGGTSGATGYIESLTDNGADGTIILQSVTGEFEASEAITDSSTGAAAITSTGVVTATGTNKNTFLGIFGHTEIIDKSSGNDFNLMTQPDGTLSGDTTLGLGVSHGVAFRNDAATEDKTYYITTEDTHSGTGTIHMQAGAGSAGWGSSLRVYGHLPTSLPYTGGTTAFTVGATVTEATSGTTGVIGRKTGTTATGTLYFRSVTGNFTGGLAITDDGTIPGSATSGTEVVRTKAGDVVAGISAASGGSFRVHNNATDSDSNLFEIDSDGKIGTNQDAANTNTPSGATAHQLPIYDEGGVLLGYIPIYGSAW